MANGKHGSYADGGELAYSLAARRYHWWIAGLVLFMIPLGLFMSADPNPLKLSDAAVDNLSSLHKLVGMVILGLVVARLTYRLRHGAPPSEPSLSTLEKGASHGLHWVLYGLLLAMPIVGWVGVSMYDSRGIFGLFNLPSLAPVNQKLSDTIFLWHGYGGWLILALVGGHAAAALYHHLIRRDGVLRRMWPGLGKKR